MLENAAELLVSRNWTDSAAEPGSTATSRPESQWETVTKVTSRAAPQSNREESQPKLEFQFKVIVTTTLFI